MTSYRSLDKMKWAIVRLLNIRAIILMFVGVNPLKLVPRTLTSMEQR